MPLESPPRPPYLPERRKGMHRPTHITLFLAGGAFQAISAFEAPWVADYRAGFLVFAGVLLSAANIRGAFGRRRQD